MLYCRLTISCRRRGPSFLWKARWRAPPPSRVAQLRQLTRRKRRAALKPSEERMMHKSLIVGMTAAACLLAGCVAVHPEVDRRAGEAVVSAQSAQTLNPRPVRDPDAVSG